MVRRSFRLSLYLVGAIASLVKAGSSSSARTKRNQLYHERKEVEEVFRRLPSIEHEIESLVDDASFYAAFQPSPPVNHQKHIDNSDNRRGLQTRKGGPLKGSSSTRGGGPKGPPVEVAPTGSTFLDANLRSAGLLGGGEMFANDNVRKGGIRGSTSVNYVPPNLFGEEPTPEEQPTYPYLAEKFGKSNKSGKGFKSEKHSKFKSFKKDKRWKGEKREGSKLTKSGKKDGSYDPYEANDDFYPLLDEPPAWESWEWEVIKEDDNKKESRGYKEVNDQFQFTDASSSSSSSSASMNGWKVSSTQDAVGGMMGRLDLSNWSTGSGVDAVQQQASMTSHKPAIAPEDPGAIASSIAKAVSISSENGAEPVANAAPLANSGFATNAAYAQPVVTAPLTNQEHVVVTSSNNGPSSTGPQTEPQATNSAYVEPVIGVFPMTEPEEVSITPPNPEPVPITAAKPDPVTGNYEFNFPTIQHMVYSGPVHLKAHSLVDLSALDPEIFAVLSSVLTPFLEKTMGPTLHSYTMEVDYSPSSDKSAGKDVVVTLMEVKCAFKVISDSVESLKEIDHIQASRWIHDFFSGPEMAKLMDALKLDNIPIHDVVFVDQDFVMDHATVASAVSSNQISSGPSSPAFKITKKSSGGAMVGVTLSVIFVGLLFFMHYTGRLPSRAEVGAFSLSARDSVARTGSKARDSIAKTSKSIGNRIKQTTRRGGNSSGRRQRTYSGTFRRHPEGGIRKAKLQKNPALSRHYLDNASTSSSSDASGAGARYCKKSSSFNDMLDHDDYSFSNYAGDYEPSNYTPTTPSRRSRTDTLGYDTDSIFSKVSKKVSEAASLLTNSPRPTKSPIPHSAPRRVTAADIASPRDDDSWSVRSCDTKEKLETKERSPSNHPLHREWNESGPQLKMESPKRDKLSIPRFSQNC